MYTFLSKLREAERKPVWSVSWILSQNDFICPFPSIFSYSFSMDKCSHSTHVQEKYFAFEIAPFFEARFVSVSKKFIRYHSLISSCLCILPLLLSRKDTCVSLYCVMTSTNFLDRMVCWQEPCTKAEACVNKQAVFPLSDGQSSFI